MRFAREIQFISVSHKLGCIVWPQADIKLCGVCDYVKYINTHTHTNTNQPTLSCKWIKHSNVHVSVLMSVSTRAILFEWKACLMLPSNRMIPLHAWWCWWCLISSYVWRHYNAIDKAKLTIDPSALQKLICIYQCAA